MKKISVITISRNAEQTIEKTIQSVIPQISKDTEFIIIDGGSTDGTVDIIKKYEEYISLWVSEPDNGIYDAMNKGLHHATGEYVNFLNSDDWFEDNVLDRVIEVINKIDADVLYGDVIRDDGIHRAKWIPETLERLYWWMPFGHQGVFVRRTDKLRFDDTYRIAADYKMMLDLYISGKKFCYLPFTIAHFGQDGISNTNNYLMCSEQVAIASKKMVAENDESIIYKERIIDVYVRSEALHQIDDADKDGLFIEYLNSFLKERQIVCFGCGIIAGSLLNILRNLNSNIKYFVDNDRTKHGKEWNYFVVKSTEVLIDEKNVDILVLMERNIDEVRRQLDSMGLNESVRVFYYDEIIDDFMIKYRQVLMDIGKKRIPEFNELCNMR